jgi:hypothetical protein
MVCRVMRRLAGSGKTVEHGMTQYVVYGVLGVCGTQCILYSVYAVLSICCTQYMLY